MSGTPANIKVIPDSGLQLRPGRAMEIFLFRHGRSTWNRVKRVQGHRDPGLAPDGRDDARRLASSLRKRFGLFSPTRDILLTSPLKRAAQTAAIIGAALDLPVVRRPALREAAHGEWEGLRVDDIRARDPKRLEQWYRDPTKVRLKGGENMLAFHDRVMTEMRLLLLMYRGAGRLLIVTHGGWVSTLLTDVVGVPPGKMWTFVVDNTSMTRLHFDGRKLYLRSFNESATSPARMEKLS